MLRFEIHPFENHMESDAEGVPGEPGAKNEGCLQPFACFLVGAGSGASPALRSAQGPSGLIDRRLT